MTTCYHMIANLYAGSGKGKKITLAVQKILQKKNIPFRFYQTEYRSHAVTLVEEIVLQMNLRTDRLLVIGGDGTLHEVITGLANSGTPVPVGYLPAGTGNDFARSVGLPASYKKGLMAILNASDSTEIDCFHYEDPALGISGMGLNSLGMGFDGKIIEILNNKHTKWSLLAAIGMEKLIYLKSIANAFKTREAFKVEVKLDEIERHFSDVLIVGAMNHPYFGGGIKIDPQSKANSKELAIMVIHNLTFPKLVHLLTQVLTNGAHIHSDYFQRFVGQSFEIKVSQPVPTQVDGEALPQNSYHFTFHLSSFLMWK